MEGKMQCNEKFMETKTSKPIHEAFNFQVKEVLSKWTNSTKPNAYHYYIEIGE
jgi:hypothetical protein